MKKVSLLMTIAAALAVMAMAAVGCGTSGDNNNNQIKCTSDQMCNNGQVCDTVNKVCIAKCNKNSDCDSGVCVLGHCVPTTSDGDVDAFDNNESSTCTPGQQTCVGTSIFACINGSLQKQTDCATLGMVCTAGNCVNGGDTDAETPACPIDAKQCVVDKVYTCTASGWSQTEDCAASSKKCQNGACVAVATCTNNDKRCSGNIVETCTNNAWGVTTDCAALGKTCSNGQCVGGGDPDVDNPVEVDNGTCTVGSTRCVGNGVFKCNSAGMWDSVEDCAASGKTCVDGACTGGSTNEGCPSGQTCYAVFNGSDAKACVVMNNGQPSIPPGATTGCSQSNPTSCPMNQICVNAGGTYVCIALCGACPSGLVCTPQSSVNANMCLDSSGNIPANAQKGCGNNTPCTGNATCYCTESTCADANNVCIGNCATGSSTSCTNGAVQCNGNIIQTCSNGSWTNGTDCSSQGKTCSNGQCVTSSGGGCASGTTCQAVSDGGAMGCLTSSGGLPSNAQKGCGNTPCTGNATCYCTESTCADANNVCIGNCSTL